MKQEEYDIIIVGTGVAGLYTALSLSEDYRILMITKDSLERSDSYLAQGGVSTLLGPDDYDVYFEDTMKAGRYENNPVSVETMIKASKDVVEDLIHYGVEFDQSTDGKMEYTREGGHSTYRILHHKDITGKEIVTKLMQVVSKKSNITMIDHMKMIDFIEKDNRCFGIVAKDNKNEYYKYFGKGIFLATGGLGGLFKNSTNFSHITGDSFSLAIRHNIEMENINYIQIHPTVLYSTKQERKFLISESVRGEGAVLLNEDNQRFVDELLPRDIVTEAIRKEMEKYHKEYVYLSIMDIDQEEIMNHFPNIYERCLAEGYDVTKDKIPVTPAQHYLMGGIKTNIYGETSMEGLYAVGETACNGVHGANRLASNSLLESLVFARNAANRFSEKNSTIEIIPINEDRYTNLHDWEEENRKMLLEEIKRRDTDFYDKWCNV